MSLRVKLFLWTTIILSLLAAFISLVFSERLLRGFTDVENQRISSNVTQVVQAFKAEVNNLDTKLIDWSTWDDAYVYMKDHNEEFIKANVNDLALTNLKINFIMFVDPAGNVVYSKGLDLLSGKAIPLPIHEHLDKPSKGIMNDGGANILFASRPILKTDGTGPSVGTLMFARVIDDQEIAKISDLTGLTFSLEPLNRSAEKDHSDVLAAFAKGEEIVVTNPTDTDAYGFAILRDQTSMPVTLVKLKAERSMYQQGIKSARLTLEIGIASAVVFLVLLLFLENSLVIYPISHIGREIAVIEKAADKTKRIREVNTRDEFDALSHSINAMLTSIEEADTRLNVEQAKLKLIQEQKIAESERQNAQLERTKRAMLNLLEDARELEEKLKVEKTSVEQKVIERTRELHDEQVRFIAAINSMKRGFAIVDIRGGIPVANSAMLSILDISLVPKTIDDIAVPFGTILNLKELFSKSLTTHTRISVDDVLVGKKYLTVTYSPILTDQAIEGAVLTIDDITERKVLERSREEFFSIASHELRTPLTAIRGNSSMIEEFYGDKISDPDMKEMLADIHESSIRLIDIVNDFLDTSRLEQGRIEFKNTSFDLVDLMQKALKEYKVAGDKSHLQLTLTPPDEAIPPVYADPDRVRQVIINLIGNSIKFTEAGGVCMSIRARNGLVEVRVTDSGRGIPLAMQSLLFRKFQQAGESLFTRDTTRGTGLGLYISKLMIEGMGGKIWLVESTPGKGSTFAFTLPVAIT